MKVFVAIRSTDPDDVFETVEGELVYMPLDRCEDGRCSCKYTMVGLASGGVTTTFTVADLDHLSRDDLLVAFADGLAKAGHDLTDAEVAEVVDETTDIAGLLPEGGTYWAMHMPT